MNKVLIALILSLIANVYMQFNYEIFSLYVKHVYCNGSNIQSMGMSTYGFSIKGHYISPLNIIKLGSTEQYNIALECSNGFKISR